jgi:hypothetical protein
LLVSAYSQESGRAGRDGQEAEAIIFYNKDDLGKSTTRPEVKEYCQLESCRRKFLAKRFGLKDSADVQFAPSKLHWCCDNCSSLCECPDCISARTTKITEIHGSDDGTVDNDVIKDVIHQTLLSVFDAINKEMRGSIDVTLCTGLTVTLADDIAQNYRYLMDFDALCIMYSYLNNDFLEAIHAILLNCREFIDSECCI